MVEQRLSLKHLVLVRSFGAPLRVSEPGGQLLDVLPIFSWSV